MYSNQDLTAIGTQRAVRRRTMLMIALIGLCMIIASFILRIQWLTIALTIVTGVLLVMIYDFAVAPVNAYYRMVKQVVQGRKHTFCGAFDHVQADESLVDGIHCHAVIFMEDSGDDHDPHERQFYLDSLRTLPEDIVTGDRIELTYSDRYICAISKA